MMRRYLAEFVGTFVIVFAPVAWSSHSQGGLLGAALVSGLSVLAMIFALGPVSAAHFNPAVTLGFAIAKRFPWKFALPYWLAQFSGAIVASGLCMIFFGCVHGAHVPADPTFYFRNIGLEAVITFILMFVIIAVATDRRVPGGMPAIAIGFSVIVGVLIGGPITGGSMNPARSVGPALFAGGPALANAWLYILGPCLGAILGAVVYEAIRLEKEHACGAPNELV